MAQLWWFDKEVTSVRDARAGDHGFVEGQTQVVVMLDDGTQYIVPRSEVTTTRAEVSHGLAPAPPGRADDERPARALKWATETFGDVAANVAERGMRFLEESIELAHAMNMPKDTAEQILNRVYGRPEGNIAMEVGQAQLTLECLAERLGLCAAAESEKEFERVQALPSNYLRSRHAMKQDLGITGDAAPSPPAPASRADDEFVSQLRQIPHQLAHEAADRIATLTKHLAERERSDHG